MRKGQYIVSQLMKDFSLPRVSIGKLLQSLPDEKLHMYEERYHKYLMKHVHPKNANLHCSAPELDTRCKCSNCIAKYGIEKPQDLLTEEEFDKLCKKNV